MAEAAYDQFQKVLEQNPKDQLAIMSIASLFLNQQKWMTPNSGSKKPSPCRPTTPTHITAWVHHLVAVVPAFGQALASLGMRQEDPGRSRQEGQGELKEKWDPVIEDGLKDLTRRWRSTRSTMTRCRTKLLIRERAYWRNQEEYEQQAKIADAWLDKAMATKKSKEEKKVKQSGGGIVAERQSKTTEPLLSLHARGGAPSAPAASVCVL